MNRTTIADVAKVAGVSRATVSRILNNKPDVAEATRQRVMQVIEDLNFQPDAQARRLAAGRSHTIAMLHPLDEYTGALTERYIDYTVMGFMYGVAKVGEENDYFFNLFTKELDARELLALYQTSRVDGIILMQTHTKDWRIDLLREYNLPFVMIGRTADNTGLNLVDVNIEDSVERMLDYLVELGHHHIGCLTYPEPSRRRGYMPAIHAWEGYQEALNKHRLPIYTREVRYGAKYSFEATNELLDEYPQITAIVAFFGGMEGILSAIYSRGRKIPQDISVIGMTMDEFAKIMSPRLTNIQFPAYEMGYKAASLLIELLDGQVESVVQHLVHPPLTVRDSTTSVK